MQTEKVLTGLSQLFTLTQAASSLQIEATKVSLHTGLEPTAIENNRIEAGFQEHHFFTLPNNFAFTLSQWMTLRHLEVGTLRRGKGWPSGDETLPLSHWRCWEIGPGTPQHDRKPPPCPGDSLLKWGM